MGFYFRKSVRLGPLRFNLSKSGIGTSVGVTGFRIGASPRGNYVHMGRGGLYYRASLTSSGSTPASHPVPQPTPLPAETTPVDTLTEIESGSVLKMMDHSSEGLLRELNEKHKKWRLWPWLLAATLIGVPFVNLGGQETATPILILVGLVGTAAVSYSDQLRRTTVLLYDLEPDAAERYQTLHDAFDQLAACQGTWHLEATGATRDQKRNAGASTLVRRRGVRVSKQPPATVRTNIEVPTIPVGRQTLCFFPDRLLVFDRAGVGAVNYNGLLIEVDSSQFIEDGSVPADATVVGQTWRYVNKKGGPDKRFKNNRQLPVCQYEGITFRSESGLNEALQASKPGAGDRLRESIRAQAVSQADS